MRRQISWLVIATTATVVVSFVIPLCLLVRTLAEDRAMAAADQEAHNAAILVAGLPDDPQLARLVASLDSRGDPATSVLTTSGQWLGSTPAPEIDSEVIRARDNGEAFTIVDDESGRVLLPVVVESGTAVIRSSVTTAELRRGVATAWVSIIGLGLVLMLLALLVASWLGRRVSEPLVEVSGVAHRLREGDLSARAEVSGPEEVEELAGALNGLAERTAELLVNERAAVADLSHRLRTPVTALRLDAEAVSSAELAQRLQEHIAALQRTIDAVVREARRPVRTEMKPVCDGAAVVSRRLAFWSALADDQGRAMTSELPAGPLGVPLVGDDLADLVDILVDNIFAHTPEGTGFAVSLRETPAGSQLRIVDEATAEPLATAQRTGSSGLGLDIARRMAIGAGGRLEVAQPEEGGIEVTVLFPLVNGCHD